MIRNNIYLFFLAILAGIIVGANYTPGTILSGWDTLHPEFNFSLAFQRAITGVWREDQGLGAVAIQSHMADLPRIVLLWIASFFLPNDLLRYALLLISLAVGPVGMYILSREVLCLTYKKHCSFASFFAALAYLCNLAVVQQFIVPLEMFTVHFATLPWLLFTALKVLRGEERFWKYAFITVTFLSVPQAHTATLFYAYFFTFFIILCSYLIIHRTLRQKILPNALFLIFTTVAVNAFWLLPNIYAMYAHGEDVRTSKVNSLFSDEAFAKNQKYGTIADVALLRGFLFDWQLRDPKTNTDVDVLAAWKQHFAYSPVIPTIGYAVFVLSLAGIGICIVKRNTLGLAFVPLFILPFLFLTNDTWPAMLILQKFRTIHPMLGEALRFPFTKFSLLFASAMSLYAGIGVIVVLNKVKQPILSASTKIFLSGFLLWYFLPGFTGQLIHPAMRITIPKNYFDLFAFLRTKPNENRVAVLPAASFWNWVNYRWGYQGAGFLQFGIPQPILDRDYDRWSRFNENYYWELSKAIYSKDISAIHGVIKKYDIRYVIFDESVFDREHGRATFVEEIKGMLGEIKDIKKIWGEGKLTLYERTGASQSFIKLAGVLPTVSPPYRWTDNDTAYQSLGDYLSGQGKPQSLFTKRSTDERDLDLAPFATPSVLVFEATVGGQLAPESVVPCGIAGGGTASAKVLDGFLRFKSLNQRNCLSFAAPSLSHKEGYLVAVESRHITGRPLLFALINETAKHTELETYLGDSKTDYFVLPPLAPDGLGYSVYLSNDSIGRYETINDIKRISFYTLPYNELVKYREGPEGLEGQGELKKMKVDHPNPAFYKITLDSQNPATLILSQSYHDGWKAFAVGKGFQEIKNRVLVNNWENGWILDGDETTIILFFLPQLLQWIGFGLLPIPFLVLFLKRFQK